MAGPTTPPGFSAPTQEELNAQRIRVQKGTTGVPDLPTPNLPALPKGTPQAQQNYERVQQMPINRRLVEPAVVRTLRRRAEGVTPQQEMQETAREVGMMVGLTMGSPLWRAASAWAPALSRLPMGVVRVIFGTLGSEAGNLLTGGPPGTGLEEAGPTLAATEGIVGAGKLAVNYGPQLAGAVGRHLPFGVGQAVRTTLENRAARRGAAAATAEAEATRQAGQAARLREGERVAVGEEARAAAGASVAERASALMAGRLATQAGQIAPPLTLPKTAAADVPGRLKAMGALWEDWREKLGLYQEAMVQKAMGMLPGGAAHKIRVPSMATVNEARVAAETAMGINPKLPLDPNNPAHRAMDQHLTQLYGPRYTEHFTLDQVARYMKDLVHAGRLGQQGLETATTLTGKGARDQLTAIMGEVERELVGINPLAWQVFREGRHAFAVGAEFVRLLRSPRIWTTVGPTAVDPLKLQQVMTRHAQQFKKRMTDAEWNDLQWVWNGGEVGTLNAPALGPARKALGTARETLAGASAAARAAERQAGSAQDLSNRLQEAQRGPRWGDDTIPRIFLDVGMTRALSAPAEPEPEPPPQPPTGGPLGMTLTYPAPGGEAPPGLTPATPEPTAAPGPAPAGLGPVVAPGVPQSPAAEAARNDVGASRENLLKSLEEAAAAIRSQGAR